MGPGGNDRATAPPASELHSLALIDLSSSFHFSADFLQVLLRSLKITINITFLLWNFFDSLPIFT